MRALGLVALLLFAPACVVLSPRTPLQVDTVVTQAEREARVLMASGDWIGARRVSGALARVRPDLPLHAELDAQLPDEVAAHFTQDLAGANAPLRLVREAGLGRRLLYWLPDRLLDLLDVVSFDIGIGPGLSVNAHLTRWAAFGLGTRASLGVGWHEGRSLGMQVLNEEGWSLPGYAQGTLLGFTHGTGPSSLGAERIDGCPCTSTELHASWRDPWAVGVEAHALVLGASVAVHPLELLDFVGGVFFYDGLGDDLATTRAPPELPHDAFVLMQTLGEIALDDETMDDYLAWRREQREGQ